MVRKHWIIVVASCALGLQLISLFFPYQNILHRFGDNEPYPPEPQYAFDLILPLLLFCFSIPLFVRLVNGRSKSTFGLALGLVSTKTILLILFSSYISEFLLNTTEIGTGAYLSLIAVAIFVLATLFKNNTIFQKETPDLLDN